MASLVEEEMQRRCRMVSCLKKEMQNGQPCRKICRLSIVVEETQNVHSSAEGNSLLEKETHNVHPLKENRKRTVLFNCVNHIKNMI